MIFRPKTKITKAEFRKRVRKIVRDKDVRKEIGDLVVKDIQGRTYRKLNLGNKGDKAYFRFREAVKGKSPKYKKRKINLTITGELLNDIATNVKTKLSGGKLEWVFQHSSKRHKSYQLSIEYQTKKGKKKTKTVRRGGRKVQSTDLQTKKVKTRRVGARYDDIREGLESYEYFYLTISEKMRLAIVKRARKIISRKLK